MPQPVVAQLYRQARADRWDLAPDLFAAALDRSVRKALGGEPDAQALERYVRSLHLEDLAVACACAEGHDGAWEHFVREYRPALYRAADALDPAGGARELADSLYGELFGLSERDGRRRSHFVYFHGRSSLATWLRAVLAQRLVDRARSQRRLEPLPPEGSPGEPPSPYGPHEAVPADYPAIMERSLSAAVAALTPKDRLRLSCYYGQGLTLAQIGRTLGEHEATVSRHLARTRREIRQGVERLLREREQMAEAEIEECFASVLADAGPLDLSGLLGVDGTRKESKGRRSKERPEGASA